MIYRVENIYKGKIVKRLGDKVINSNDGIDSDNNYVILLKKIDSKEIKNETSDNN